MRSRIEKYEHIDDDLIILRDLIESKQSELGTDSCQAWLTHVERLRYQIKSVFTLQ